MRRSVGGVLPPLGRFAVQNDEVNARPIKKQYPLPQAADVPTAAADTIRPTGNVAATRGSLKRQLLDFQSQVAAPPPQQNFAVPVKPSTPSRGFARGGKNFAPKPPPKATPSPRKHGKFGAAMPSSPCSPAPPGGKSQAFQRGSSFTNKASQAMSKPNLQEQEDKLHAQMKTHKNLVLTATFLHLGRAQQLFAEYQKKLLEETTQVKPLLQFQLKKQQSLQEHQPTPPRPQSQRSMGDLRAALIARASSAVRVSTADSKTTMEFTQWEEQAQRVFDWALEQRVSEFVYAKNAVIRDLAQQQATLAKLNGRCEALFTLHSTLFESGIDRHNHLLLSANTALRNKQQRQQITPKRLETRFTAWLELAKERVFGLTQKHSQLLLESRRALVSPPKDTGLAENEVTEVLVGQVSAVECPYLHLLGMANKPATPTAAEIEAQDLAMDLNDRFQDYQDWVAHTAQWYGLLITATFLGQQRLVRRDVETMQQFEQLKETRERMFTSLLDKKVALWLRSNNTFSPTPAHTKAVEPEITEEILSERFNMYTKATTRMSQWYAMQVTAVFLGCQRVAKKSMMAYKKFHALEEERNAQFTANVDRKVAVWMRAGNAIKAEAEGKPKQVSLWTKWANFKEATEAQFVATIDKKVASWLRSAANPAKESPQERNTLALSIAGNAHHNALDKLAVFYMDEKNALWEEAVHQVMTNKTKTTQNVIEWQWRHQQKPSPVGFPPVDSISTAPTQLPYLSLVVDQDPDSPVGWLMQSVRKSELDKAMEAYEKLVLTATVAHLSHVKAAFNNSVKAIQG